MPKGQDRDKEKDGKGKGKKGFPFKKGRPDGFEQAKALRSV